MRALKEADLEKQAEARWKIIEPFMRRFERAKTMGEPYIMVNEETMKYVHNDSLPTQKYFIKEGVKVILEGFVEQVMTEDDKDYLTNVFPSGMGGGPLSRPPEGGVNR